MKLARALAVAAIALGAAGAPAGCSGGVVGGECREGFGFCEGHCIDLRSDVDNCGSCGTACTEPGLCSEGKCQALLEGGASGGAPSSSGGATSSSGGAGTAGAGGSGTAGAGGSAAAGAGGAIVDGGAGGQDGSVGGGGGSVNAGGTGGVLNAGGAGGALNAGGAGGSVNAGGAGGSVNAGGAGGSVNAGGTAGAGGANAGGASGGGGTGVDGGTCDPPFDTPQRCGACDAVCPPATPICSYGEGYYCTSLCQAPLVQCGQQCVNTDNDPRNCGRCNRRCVSGLCQGGTCVGATGGHETLICMDYRTTAPAGSPPEQILENAVFIGPRATVRILRYHQYTSNAVFNAVNRTLDNAATARNRAYTPTDAASGADVANLLNVIDYDVLLVYDQPAAPAGRLAAIGATWVQPIESFALAGGSVIVLAGDGGRGEMDDLLTASAMLPVTAQPSVTDQPVYNRAIADAIGINVLSPFRAPRETCTFTTPAPDPFATFVITDTPRSAGSLGAPVVVHRALEP